MSFRLEAVRARLFLYVRKKVLIKRLCQFDQGLWPLIKRLRKLDQDPRPLIKLARTFDQGPRALIKLARTSAKWGPRFFVRGLLVARRSRPCADRLKPRTRGNPPPQRNSVYPCAQLP